VPIRILYISLNYAAGIATGRTLDIKRLDRAGLIATNDWLAAGIRSGLAQQGGPVLPIVSFDGLPLAAEPSLAIQSLKVPIDDIADDAIAELGRLHRSQAPSARLLTYRLTR